MCVCVWGGGGGGGGVSIDLSDAYFHIPPAESLEIPEVCYSRSDSRVQSSAIRAHHSTKGVHKSGQCNRPVSESKRRVSLNVFGRLASVQSLSQQAATGQRLCAQGHHLAGVHPKSGKVRLNTSSGLCIHMGTIQAEPGFSSSTRRQVSQVKPCDSRGFVSKEYGKCLSNSQNSGFDGLSHTTGPLGEIAHEAYSTLPTSFLETIKKTNSGSNSVKRPYFSSSEMVAEQTKCYDRGFIGEHCSGNNLNNRRLPIGVGVGVGVGGWGWVGGEVGGRWGGGGGGEVGGGGGGVIADRKKLRAHGPRNRHKTPISML